MKSKASESPDILPEYDFRNGRRGRYAARYAAGTNLVLLDPDVAVAFGSSEAVNDALRRVMAQPKSVGGQLFIERRPDGAYAVRRPGAGRASAIEQTQGDAIARARQLDPNAAIHVERVRSTNRGAPDKWRRP